MELKEMIEKGAVIKGSMKELAIAIGISAKALTEAKSGRQGLPNAACGKLGELIEVDR